MSFWQSMVRASICVLMTLSASVHAQAEVDNITKKMTEACEGLLKGDVLDRALARWSGKTVVVDTNVIMNDPFAVYKYPGAEVIIPLAVLEELDDNKNNLQTGLAVRQFAREMDSVLEQGGNLFTGVQLDQGTTLRVDAKIRTDLLSFSAYDPKKKDNEIIATALYYFLSNKGTDGTFLISDDINVRIKASSEGITALPFEYEWVRPAREVEQIYKELVVSDKDLARFAEEKFLAVPAGFKIAPNQFVMIRTEKFAGSPDFVARYVFDREAPEKSGLRKLRDFSDLPFQPKNVEQQMALEVMLDPTVDFVILESEAGTGKTFVTMLAGLMQIPTPKENKAYETYEDMMITRPMVHMGKTELGALPGTKDEKLAEYFNAYYDNLRILRDRLKPGTSKVVKPPSRNDRRGDVAAGLGGVPSKKSSTHPADLKPDANMLEVTRKPLVLVKDKNKPVVIDGVSLLAFPYVRGRSLHKTFVVVDEFQNTSIHEAKTLLTRLGEGSKLIVLGDTGQIDLPYLNTRNNGLSVAISLFAADNELSDEDRSRVAFVRFKEVVRSPFNDLANRQFKKPLPRH